jgi:pimeloyl-ACP methyl ester carboxylesterase
MEAPMSTCDSVITLDDGFKVGVTQAGPEHGHHLVYLHGWSVSALAYRELVEHLADLDFRVTALDAADHGRSSSLPWGHSIRDMVDVTRDALDRLGIEEAVMAGHSLGGAMVIDFAARYPERTLAAILLDPAAGQEHHDAVRVALSPDAGARAAELIVGALRDVFGDARLAAKHRTHTELLSLGRRLGQSFSGFNMLKAGVALLGNRTAHSLAAMKRQGIPTALIHGGDDQIVSLESAISASLRCGAELQVLEGLNHSWLIAAPKSAALKIAETAWRLTEIAA